MKHGSDRIVYTHVAKEDLIINDVFYRKGDVLYVGSGAPLRVFSKTDRSSSHLEIWNKIEFVIIHEKLTKDESLVIEQEILDQLKDKPLLNIHRTVYRNTPILYKDVSNYFYLDEEGVLRILQDVFGGIRMKILVKAAGELTGYKSKHNGYWSVRFKGKTLKLHRVVWVLHNKTDLDSNLPIDHVDRNKDNNRPENLRLTTDRENNLNKDYRLSNLGIPRIRYSEKQILFHIQWTVSGKKQHKYFPLKTLLKKGVSFDVAYDLKYKEALLFLEVLKKKLDMQ